MPRRAARGLGCSLIVVAGWLVAFLAIAATFVGFSYLRSGHPPYCSPVMPGFRPPAGALPLDYLRLVAVPGATLLVGLWWALGGRTAGSQARRLIVLVPLALAVSVVGLLAASLLSLFAGAVFVCPVLV